MSLAGQHQYIEQNTTDGLSVRLMADDQTEIALVGPQQLSIDSPSGSELLAITAVGVTISGNEATLSQAWSDATYTRDHGFRANWTLTDGATTYLRTQYFSIVRRVFRSTLEDTDITNIHPYITTQNQQANLSLYKQEAWEEIQAICKARIPPPSKAARPPVSREWTGAGGVQDYPGNFFNPEDFRQAHLYLTLSWFFDHNSFGNADQNEARALRYREQGTNALDLALSRISFDRDGDGIIEDWERDWSFNMIRMDR